MAIESKYEEKESDPDGRGPIQRLGGVNTVKEMHFEKKFQNDATDDDDSNMRRKGSTDALDEGIFNSKRPLFFPTTCMLTKTPSTPPSVTSKHTLAMMNRHNT